MTWVTVGRDFSTMNRILTDLRNRLATQRSDQLMRISIKEPLDLDSVFKYMIFGCWKSKKLRKIFV